MPKATEADIKDAIDAIVNRKYSIYRAATEFEVPRSTLHRRLQSGNKKKLPTVLTEGEEAQFVNWMTDIVRRGFSVSKEALKDSVQEHINQTGRQTCFKNNRPGRDWFERFITRHPTVTQRIAESITRSRAMVTEVAIRKWFAEVMAS